MRGLVRLRKSHVRRLTGWPRHVDLVPTWRRSPGSPGGAAATPRPVPLVAVIGTWNEVDVIGSCVANARLQGCERVLLVDNASTDGTVAAAEEAGAEVARVFETPRWDERRRVDIMTEVAREAVAAVGSASVWVLFLDADEFPTGTKGRTIRSVVDSLPPTIRVVGSRAVDHYPERPEGFRPGTHPVDVAPRGVAVFEPMCLLGHWKHQLVRADRREDGSIDLPDLALGFHSVARSGRRWRETGEALLVHHVPFRNESAARARSGALLARTGTVDPSHRRQTFLDALYRGRWEEVRLRRTRLGDRPLVLRPVPIRGMRAEELDPPRWYERSIPPVVPDLVFDVGMHLGEDTAFYLSRGFRVVGVEANPRLHAALRRRFAEALADRRLVLEPVAIGRETGRATLLVNDAVTVWGTLDRGFAERNEPRVGTSEPVEVPTVALPDLLVEHGVPRYLKIDIEGFDRVALESLFCVPTRPPFVSVESVATTLAPSVRAVRGELRVLRDLGYRRFAFVNQERLSRFDGRLLDGEGTPAPYRYERHSSGPFGDDLDRWRGPTRTLLTGLVLAARQNLTGDGGHWSGTAFGRLARRTENVVEVLSRGRFGRLGWYDLHGRLAMT